MNLQFTTEDMIRLAAAAEERGMSVEQFVLDAVERALRPIESRRHGAAREIFELESLWRTAGEPDDGPERGKP